MKLVSARITNFRSVLDTGLFTLSEITCLVGKNESGKTTVLQALERIKPVDKLKKKFDKDLDYPRGFLAEYEERHPDTNALVVVTDWELTADEVGILEAEFGDDCLETPTLKVMKSHDQDGSTWLVPLDEAVIVSNILTRFGVKGADKKTLTVQTVRDLRSKIEAVDDPSEEVTGVLAVINSYRNKSAVHKAIDLLHPSMPEFLYFSSYDRMDGRVQLEALEAAGDGQLAPGLQIFRDFLEFAGTSAEQLRSATTFEKLKAKVEAASISISKQVFAYWSQNRHLKVEFSVEGGRSGDPAPFNTGHVMHTRIRNKLHDMTVPFDDRSTGFTWFFSFLVKFSQV
jgi:energy-coupling factor transporter ATP-binding protein EcfA2